MFMAKPRITNSVMEYFLAASGNLRLAYAINLGFPF